MKFRKDVYLATELLRSVSTTPTRVRKLAESIGTSEDFLHRIVGKLRKADLVSVKAGAGGGVFKNPNRSAITVLEVLRAISPVDSGMKEGTFLAAVHNDVLNFLSTQDVCLGNLETENGKRGEA